MASHGNRILGTALVAIGLLMLLAEMGIAGLGWLWPTILLVISVGILLQYHRDRDDSGKVFTGVTLLLLAFFFQLNYLDRLGAREHWPFFLLAPGIGLLVMARVDAHRRDAMVPGWILVAAAAVGYFFSLGAFVWLLEKLFSLIGLILKVAVPVGLIALGGWLLFTQRRDDHGPRDVPEKVEPEGEGPGGAGAGGAAGSGPESGSTSPEDEVDEYAAVADLPPRGFGTPEPRPSEEDAEYEEDAGGEAPSGASGSSTVELSEDEDAGAETDERLDGPASSTVEHDDEARETGEEPRRVPGEEPTSEPQDEPGEESDQEPGDEPTDERPDEPTDEPTDESADEPDDDTGPRRP